MWELHGRCHTEQALAETSMEGLRMNLIKHVLSGALVSIFVLTLTLTAGATTASAEESAAVDQDAVEELSRQLEELKRAGEFDGDTSVDGLIRDNTGLTIQAKPNGCSAPKGLKGYKSWSKLFKPACDNHDRCYSKGSKKDRKTCDNEFRTATAKICVAKKKPGSGRITCLSTAAMYVTFVRAFGKSHYKGSGKNN